MLSIYTCIHLEKSPLFLLCIGAKMTKSMIYYKCAVQSERKLFFRNPIMMLQFCRFFFHSSDRGLRNTSMPASSCASSHPVRDHAQCLDSIGVFFLSVVASTP